MKQTILSLLFLSTICPDLTLAQGTAFTYQGRLDNGGSPANGIFDVQFAIFDSVNGAFVSASDRNVKEDFQPVDPQAVLAKVVALPLSEWRYKADEEHSRHLGPVAQDFHAAFGLGADDKHIATVDADGVALAAIQGLNKKVELRNAKSEGRIQVLEAENAALRARLEKLEHLFEARVAR